MNTPMNNRFVACLALMLLCLFSCAPRLKPELVVLDVRTQSLLDRIIIVDIEEFSDSRIIQRLTSFAYANKDMPVARLTISNSELTALSSIRSSYINDAGIGFFTPEAGSTEESDQMIAQVNCREGSASIRLRRGNKIEEKLIFGKADPTKLNLGNNVIGKIVSLVVDLQQSTSNNEPKGQLTYLLRSSTLPSIEDATLIGQMLSKQHPEMFIGLAIRTDTHFYMSNGPLFDHFDLPNPYLSRTAYIESPYIECLIGDECRIRTLVALEESLRKNEREMTASFLTTSEKSKTTSGNKVLKQNKIK